MTIIKNRCWSFARPAAKPIWVLILTSFLLCTCLFVQTATAGGDGFAFEGLWAFDKDASDSQQKILRSLEKQLAIQKSFEYPQKASEKNSKTANTNNKIISSAPDFLFSQTDLQLQVVDKKLTLSQAEKHREISLQGNNKSFSLKQFTSNTLTAVASIKDGKLFIDSTTSGGLFIGETFYVDGKNRLIQQLRINDGIHESLYLQRVYQACASTCKKN